MLRTAIVIPLFILLASSAAGQGAPRARPDNVHTVLTGRWSAAIGGVMWDLTIHPEGHYSILGIDLAGDSLVVSMGAWALRGGDAEFCVTPVRREPICGPLRITAPDDPARTEWRFRDPRGRAFAWVAHRRGYAPWDTLRARRREGDIYEADEVALRPRMLGCSEPVRVPEDERHAATVTVRFIVEPDSTTSHVEVAAAPSAALEDRARTVIASCRAAPGRLANGRPVRVHVESTLTLRRPAPTSRP